MPAATSAEDLVLSGELIGIMLDLLSLAGTATEKKT